MQRERTEALGVSAILALTSGFKTPTGRGQKGIFFSFLSLLLGFCKLDSTKTGVQAEYSCVSSDVKFSAELRPAHTQRIKPFFRFRSRGTSVLQVRLAGIRGVLFAPSVI